MLLNIDFKNGLFLLLFLNVYYASLFRAGKK